MTEEELMSYSRVVGIFELDMEEFGIDFYNADIAFSTIWEEISENGCFISLDI